MREKCVECDKTLRNYVKGDKKIHRKCWLNLRDKSERHYDYLFCKDKDKREMKKMEIVKPIDEYPELIDIAGNIISSLPSPPLLPPIGEPVELTRS
jgi:hypothetical protein